MNIEEIVLREAKKTLRHIVFPESNDERIIKAIDIIVKKKIAKVTIIGDVKKTTLMLKKHCSSWKKINVISQRNPSQNYINSLFKKRKHKGMTIDKAKKLLNNPMYYAIMMLEKEDCDGVVAGATWPTAQTFRPALQIIGTAPGIKTASSYFIMNGKRTFFFADCALNINPDEKQLADISISTNDSAKIFGFKPKVAMLSFSTKGSAKNEISEKVVNATKIVKKKRKDIMIDGELQVDAAIVPLTAKSKAPDSKIKGDANVLIFPDLNSGNISYKLVEQIGNVTAIGPISQGLKKPVNDLSRGCSIKDIVLVTAVTAIQVSK